MNNSNSGETLNVATDPIIFKDQSENKSDASKLKLKCKSRSSKSSKLKTESKSSKLKERRSLKHKSLYSVEVHGV